NKFEFRAVGSSQSIAGPIVVLNTIVAESLDFIATELEKSGKKGDDLNVEIQDLLQKIIAESKAVIFNGDGYSEAWHQEAAARGLPNRKNTVDSLPDLIAPESIELFGKYGVFSEREIHSRYEILLESYKKTINIEAQLTAQIAKKQILPSCLRYQTEIANSISALKSAGVEAPASEIAFLKEISSLIGELQARSSELAHIADHHADGDSLAHAKYSRDVIIPAMAAVREVADKLELIVADDLWPLPTYQEMLFIK
ncbi:MAG: glutamine synthetase type III, partial [Planctomycetota bacterium]